MSSEVSLGADLGSDSGEMPERYMIQYPPRKIPARVLGDLCPASREAIHRLLQHRPRIPYNPTTPRTAAVFLGLFDAAIWSQTASLPPGLQVLLTTRAHTLRTHPSQTALPGGRCDLADGGDVDVTARREAWEEVGLKVNERDGGGLWKVTALEPFMSKYGLIVYPVIYLITSPTILHELIPFPNEVAHIFSFPLESCLTGVYTGKREDLVERGGEWWPYAEEGYNQSDTIGLGGCQYRMHRFRTTASPLKGLTSDILISTATIAYDRPPAFPLWPENPIPTKRLMWNAVRDGACVVGIEDKRPRGLMTPARLTGVGAGGEARTGTVNEDVDELGERGLDVGDGDRRAADGTSLSFVMS